MKNTYLPDMFQELNHKLAKATNRRTEILPDYEISLFTVLIYENTFDYYVNLYNFPQEYPVDTTRLTNAILASFLSKEEYYDPITDTYGTFFKKTRTLPEKLFLTWLNDSNMSDFFELSIGGFVNSLSVTKFTRRPIYINDYYGIFLKDVCILHPVNNEGAYSYLLTKHGLYEILGNHCKNNVS